MKDIKVIVREYEWERLDDCIDKEEAQLVVVYGRRRVGKIFLVNKYFKDRFDFKITGVYNQPSKIQLFNFLEELNKRSEKNMVCLKTG